jgi:hypothetical protein
MIVLPPVARNSTGNKIRCELSQSGLTPTTSGLDVRTIDDYNSNHDYSSFEIESCTPGTFVAPDSGKVRFGSVGSSFPLLYEFQFDDSLFAVAASEIYVLVKVNSSVVGSFMIPLV